MDNYEILEILAVQWHPQLAEQFPNADHTYCLQEMWFNEDTDMWDIYEPSRCMGYHCPKCGSPCNMMGHHTCAS